MATMTKQWGAPAAIERSRVTTGVVWALQILGAAMFAFAGFSKLSGAPDMVGAFAAIGIGQWFRYLTGTIEVVSAALLLVPALAVYGAIALAVTMVGAIVTHVAIIGGSPVAAIVLLIATSAIVWMRRAELQR
jgi:putative oxidoreductase